MDSCNRFSVEGILKNLKKIHHSFADNEIIFPGFIDVHVHAREDISGKHNYKEDFESAMRAAQAGAVCAFMDMPNNPSPPLDELSWNQKYELIKSKGFENKIFPYALINKESTPLKRKVPYKLFLGSSTGQMGMESREMVERILKKYEGQWVSFHAEDAAILEQDKTRPPSAEISAVDFVIYLTRKFNLHSTICHISTKGALDLVFKAKEKKHLGLDLSLEAAPHHFCPCGGMGVDLASIKVNPPIRKDEDRKAVLEAIREGKINFLATDHAPHTDEEKQCGACGISGLDLYGHMVAWLLFREEIPVEHIYKMCCEGPRQFLSHFMDLSLLPRSLSILKPEETIANRDNFKSKGKYSPYHGMKFPGHAYLYDLHEGGK